MTDHMDSTAERQLPVLIEVMEYLGDWLIVEWGYEFEGWVASLHDTSGCYCHADDDLKCHQGCCDPTNLTPEMVEVLVALGIAKVEATHS